jgi:hypothetical protein
MDPETHISPIPELQKLDMERMKSSTANQSASSSERSPSQSNTEELRLAQFLEREQLRLSYAVTASVSIALQHAVVFGKTNDTSFLGVGNLFIAFMKVASSDRGKQYEFSSLPCALVEQLDWSEARFGDSTARYDEIQKAFENEDHETGLIWRSTFTEVLTKARQIRERCTRSNTWLAARHLVAAMLQLNQAGGAAEHELQNVGFDTRLVLKALHEHLEYYRQEDDAQAWRNFLERFAEYEQISKTSPHKSGTRMSARREAQDDELCLDIDAYSQAIADTFNAAAVEGDFVFALYGPWGRGKSTLIKRVASILGGDKNRVGMPGRGYKPIFFSAWKYPTRPEVWIFLYQKIAAAAQEAGFWQRLRIGFRVGLLKNGWWPLIAGFALLAASRLQFEFAHWLFNGLGAVGLLIVGSFVWSASTTGRRVAHSYFSTPDHGEKLGLQAVIGRDLKNLLHVWITPKGSPNAEDEKKTESLDFAKWPARWRMACVVLLAWVGLGLVGWKLHHYAPQPRAKSAPDQNQKSGRDRKPAFVSRRTRNEPSTSGGYALGSKHF